MQQDKADNRADREIDRMSNEREFIEGIMNTRFDFFLVFVAGIVVAVVEANESYLRYCIYTLGIVVSAQIWATIYRSHLKLNLILEWLKNNAPAHPYVTIEVAYKAKDNRVAGSLQSRIESCSRYFGDRRYFVPSVRWLIGWGIPFTCIAILFLAYYCEVFVRRGGENDRHILEVDVRTGEHP